MGYIGRVEIKPEGSSISSKLHISVSCVLADLTMRTARIFYARSKVFERLLDSFIAYSDTLPAAARIEIGAISEMETRITFA